MTLSQGPNHRWSLDFVSDTLTDSGFREFDAVIARRGPPLTIVSDNGTEFTSMAILRWSQQTQDRAALHRTRQAAAERIRRKLQWAPARRTPERDVVLVTTPAKSLPNGRTTTTPSALTARSAIFHRQPAPSSTRPTCNGTERMS